MKWFVQILSIAFLSTIFSCGAEQSKDYTSTTDERRKSLDPAGVNFLMKAQTAYEQGAYGPALAFTDSVMAYDADLADIYFLRARIFTEMMHYENAVNSYDKVLSLDPNYQGARYNKANLAFIKGDNREAITLLKEEAERFPASRVWTQLGRVYAKISAVDSAEQSYKKAIQMDSTNATAYMWLGQLYEDEGQLENALDYSSKGLQLNPDNPNYRYIVGSELFRNGKVDTAITLLEEVTSELPWHAGAHYNLGQAYVRKGLKDKGEKYLTIADSLQKEESNIEELESMAQMNPDTFMRWINLGDAYLKMGQLENAMNAYKTALVIEPWNFALQNNIADLTVALGDTTRGIERYIAILKQNPNLADVWLNLGVAYANSGRYQDAQWAWNKALDADPDHTMAKDYLTQLEDMQNE